MERETVLEGPGGAVHPATRSAGEPGPLYRTIPREETALGIREGTAREIAILSRVGKPIAVTVTGLGSGDPPQLLLSRRQAQERALEALLSCPPGRCFPPP